MKRVVELGDIVRLRSGGPKMTVCAVQLENGALEKGVVTCAYFVGEEIRNIIVPQQALVVWASEEGKP